MKPAKTDSTNPAAHDAAAGGAKPPLRIALVEDQPKTLESWMFLINSFPDFKCVCACSTGEQAVKLIPKEKPDVVLMDIFLPRMSGIECTATLKALLPKTQIVMLSAMDDQELIFLALEAGADGYLLKRTKPAELRTALLDVLNGGAPMTSQIARRVIESFRRNAKAPDKGARLTAREEQTLALLSQGYSNKMIAEKLEVTVDTVCSHLKHVFRKLQVNSRTEAAVQYMTGKLAREWNDA